MALQKRTPWKLLVLLVLASAAAAEFWDMRDDIGQESGGIGLAGGSDLEDTAPSGSSGAGSGSGSYDESDSGYDESDSGYDESDSGYDQSAYGYDESDTGYDQSAYGYDESDFGYDQSDFGYDESAYGNDESDFGYDESDFGYDQSDFGYDQSDFGYDESDFGYDESDFDYDESDYGYDQSDFSYGDSDYGYDSYEYGDDSYDNTDPDYDFDAGFDRGFDEGFDLGFDRGDSDEFELRDRYPSRRPSRRGRRPRRVEVVQMRSADVEPESEPDAEREADPEAGGREMEFEDGSASPDEIPRGYFSQQAGQPLAARNRPAEVISGGIDLPGFRVIIGDALQQWWKHDANVCLQKEFLRPREFEDSDAHMSMYSVRCGEDSAARYSCTISQWNGTKATSQQLTYTCCPGFTRLSGDRGCPRRVVSSPSGARSFAALLRERGYSQRAIDLFGTVLSNDTKRQWTVFVPAKEALEAVISSVEARRDQVPQWFVRTLLNHFAEPALSTQSMRSGQSVATLAKPSTLLISKTSRGGALANCQPLVLPNQIFNRYSLVHFTTAVLSVKRQNLYQMMLERLENVTSSDNAKRLLAPLKPTLTGSKPVTVFMHLPAVDEADNGCYARNLRAAIVNGVECNSSLSTLSALRTIDGKLLRVCRQSTERRDRVLIDGNRFVISADHVASNGVLHVVGTTESLTGFSNEVTRRLKLFATFRPLFARPNRTEGDLVLLLPPVNGSHSYENTSSRWNNHTELSSFGIRHLLANATNLGGPIRRLKMMDGIPRDFVQLVQRSPGASIFSQGRLVRRLFVDCVPVVRTAKDCGGTIYFLLRGELPEFRSSPTVLDYLNTSENDIYSLTKTILSFGIEHNISGLSEVMRRSDVAIMLLKDVDMQRLSGPLLLRRRRPTPEQMTKLVQWFVRYFVAPRQVCAAKKFSPSLRVPVFRIDARPCRSIVCALRRQMTSELRVVLLKPGGQVTVREGFLLTGRVAR